MTWLDTTERSLYTLILLGTNALLILAIAKRLPWGIGLVVSRWRTMSLALWGGVLLIAGLFLGAEMLRIQSRAATTSPTQPATVSPAPSRSADTRRRPARAILAAPPHETTVALYSEPATYLEWGCEQARNADARLVLPPGAEFVSGEIELMEVVAAKSYNLGTIVFDPGTRTTIGGASFRGLDKNCPGGGHARFRLKVVVRRYG
jgi:hypothetical protein